MILKEAWILPGPEKTGLAGKMFALMAKREEPLAELA
jgi:hypothetical protein